MCVPGCHQVVMQRLSRRGFFMGLGGTAAAAAGTSGVAPPAAAQGSIDFSRAVDLTHPLTEDFPTFFGEPQLEIEELVTYAEDGFNGNRWHLDEHTGTHIDAPFHFSPDGPGPADIPAEQLVVPFVVVDVRAQAEEDPAYQLTPADIAAWESAHGALPEGCCVAMNSGWARHVDSDRFRNVDGDGIMQFPGFHVEATDMLMSERNAVGIAVDTLSLDHGPSQDFAVHYSWLPSGRWGLEAVANLDEVPAAGAILVVGAPKVVGASGGPSRLIALV